MSRINLDKIQLRRIPNTEITDPGIVDPQPIKDEYIPPKAASPLSMVPNPWSNNPLRWVQTLLAKRRVSEEAGEIIAKIEKLSQSPDMLIRYFFDNDLPQLVRLSKLQPLVVHQMLATAFEKSPNSKQNEPWFRLVQVACGDATAILPALESV